jgi:hypothetical protein
MSYSEVHKDDNIIRKIPSNLPFSKGGIIPLFGKEGQGEILGNCQFNYNLLNNIMIYLLNQHSYQPLFQ